MISAARSATVVRLSGTCDVWTLFLLVHDPITARLRGPAAHEARDQGTRVEAEDRHDTDRLALLL
eukprot:m.51237 g.51237  ORF g.51237 m.51237 type:complete len:65 (-) comp9041_c0_seq2:6-200(-)